MYSQARLWIILALLVGCPGSVDGGGVGGVSMPDELIDSLGYAFTQDADSGEVRPVGTVPKPPACDEDAFGELDPDGVVEWNVDTGDTGLLQICASGNLGGNPPSGCRPVVCDGPRDCPSSAEVGFGCDGGFCRCSHGPCRRFEENARFEDSEVIALCLQSTPRATVCPWDLESFQVIGDALDGCDESNDLCPVADRCR